MKPITKDRVADASDCQLAHPSVTPEQRIRLLAMLYPMVREVVSQIQRKLPHYANCEDLHSAGVRGLVKAVCRYTADNEARFRSYVTLRIRGAVIDELRRNDPLSRTARRRSREHAQIVEKLRQRYRREPTEQEIREEMGLDPRSYRKLQQMIQPRNNVRLDEPVTRERTGHSLSVGDRLICLNTPSPSENLERRELVSSMKSHMSKLTEREQFLIQKYYFEGWKLADIAREFGVSEARACQLHSRALRSLRIALEQV